MFGFSFSELIVVLVVAMIVIGPKDLPKMLRKLGKWAGKARRIASDLRAQSGIDEALRTEGLTEDINEIRKLARGELDSVQRSARLDDARPATALAPAAVPATAYLGDFYVVREREYPRDGADSFGALPDNAIVYAEGLPKSKLGRDALYVVGDPNAELPPEPPKPTFGEAEPDGANGEPNEAAEAAPEASEPAVPTKDESNPDKSPEAEAH